VAWDQLALVQPPAVSSSQAEFLSRYGIDELRKDAAAVWRSGGAAGGIDALRARSRVGEADALLDPGGLGGFDVVEWVVGRRRPGRG
jgi:hypothetical protein